MGYELTGFVGEVDEEFICLICYMVLENPLQLSCDHVFCSDCIRRWLLVQTNCPVERQVVRLADIKPIPRYFRNMLNKLQVRCEFGKLTLDNEFFLNKHHLAEVTFALDGSKTKVDAK